MNLRAKGFFFIIVKNLTLCDSYFYTRDSRVSMKMVVRHLVRSYLDNVCVLIDRKETLIKSEVSISEIP